MARGDDVRPQADGSTILLDAPFICDEPVPGDGYYVLTTDQHLSREVIADIQRVWEDWIRRPYPRPLLVLDAGMQLRRIDAPHAWPLAEFCAA